MSMDMRNIYHLNFMIKSKITYDMESDWNLLLVYVGLLSFPNLANNKRDLFQSDLVVTYHESSVFL